MDDIVYVPEVDLTESDNPKNFTNDTIALIYERDEYHCQACGRGDGIMEAVPHHVFFKSQVSVRIANRIENGVLLCKKCHRMVHNGGTSMEVAYGAKYDKKLKQRAIALFRESGDIEACAEVESIMRATQAMPLKKQPLSGILLL